jgi:hypothetical protein
MLRGIFHLILYRFVYQNFVIDASEVSTLGDLLQFLLWPFLLYLRVSGQFHIIVGLLHLFGFNLPETHRLYYLSSSFTDFWRRINIYWKDFMMTVVYYPLYFKLRKRGDTAALIVATLFVFFVTWFLHAYQWFWIRGTFLFTWNDTLFWTVLAIFMLGNALYERKHGRHRTLGEKALPWSATVATALRTVGVFFAMCILWSFWSAPSVGQWFSAWGALRNISASDIRLVPLFLMVALSVGLPAILLTRGAAERPYNFARSMTRVVVTSVFLIGIALPEVYNSFGPTVRKTIASLQQSELNQRDFAQLEKGYYENLLDVNQFNPELWEVYRTRPEDWTLLRHTEAARFTGKLPLFELVPSREVRHNGALVRTNSWGMRDNEYARTRPPNTMRIAVLGSSFVMGSGVENHEKFEAILEERLNREAEGTRYSRYEILNFGVAGYSSLEHLAVLESKVFDFDPHWVFYFEHADALRPLLNHLSEAIKFRAEHPYDYLRAVARKAGIDEAGVDENTQQSAINQKLRPFATEILAWIYRQIVDTCRTRGIPAVWIYLPRPEKHEQVPPELELRLAKEAGFTILDLSGVYSGHALRSLWVARWDHHPNALGNRLIADRLYEVLREREGLFSFELSHVVEPSSRVRSIGISIGQ